MFFLAARFVGSTPQNTNDIAQRQQTFVDVDAFFQPCTWVTLKKNNDNTNISALEGKKGDAAETKFHTHKIHTQATIVYLTHWFVLLFHFLLNQPNESDSWFPFDAHLPPPNVSLPTLDDATSRSISHGNDWTPHSCWSTPWLFWKNLGSKGPQNWLRPGWFSAPNQPRTEQ
jgi:hypothetical protein